jgi:hypothetical protein
MSKEKSMGNYGKAIEEWDYKKITFEDMISYIESIKNADEREEAKAWFKSIAVVDGKYKHLTAKKAFCRKYVPDIVPVAKKKVDILKDW